MRRTSRLVRCARIGHDALVAMSLDYASDHLTAAVRSLATSEEQLAERLQAAWGEHVQMVWMKPCLTRDLLREFRDLWQRYTAPSDDRQSTKLRELTHDESVTAIDELISLANKVAGCRRGFSPRRARNARRPAIGPQTFKPTIARSRRGRVRRARGGTRAGRAGTGRAGCSAAARRRGARCGSRPPSATPTGAAESHSYWPPPCAYTSPVAEHAPPSPSRPPIPSGRARRRAVRRGASASSGGRVRDTRMRIGPSVGGASAGAGSVDEHQPLRGERDRRRGRRVVLDQRDVHRPVGASGLAVLARPVERVDDPDARTRRAVPDRPSTPRRGSRRRVGARGRNGRMQVVGLAVAFARRYRLRRAVARAVRRHGARLRRRVRDRPWCLSRAVGAGLGGAVEELARRARRSTPASTGFTSIASTSARRPRNLSASRSSSSRIVDRGSRSARLLEPQVDRDRDAAHVADLEVEDDEVGILERHGVAHVLAARDLDDPLARADECRAHLVAHPLRVGGHEDRRAHRARQPSIARCAVSPTSSLPDLVERVRSRRRRARGTGRTR